MRNALFLTLVLLSAACGPKAPTVVNMAADLCKCMEPVAEAYTTMNSAPDDTRPGEIATLLENFEAEVEAFEACVSKLEETYGEALDTEEHAIRGVMHTRCSEVADVMDAMDNSGEPIHHHSVE